MDCHVGPLVLLLATPRTRIPSLLVDEKLSLVGHRGGGVRRNSGAWQFRWLCMRRWLKRIKLACNALHGPMKWSNRFTLLNQEPWVSMFTLLSSVTTWAAVTRAVTDPSVGIPLYSGIFAIVMSVLYGSHRRGASPTGAIRRSPLRA